MDFLDTAQHVRRYTNPQATKEQIAAELAQAKRDDRDRTERMQRMHRIPEGIDQQGHLTPGSKVYEDLLQPWSSLRPLFLMCVVSGAAVVGAALLFAFWPA